MALTIIGLGPGAADDLTRRAWHALERAETIYLRTSRHPCVPALPNPQRHIALDGIYESEVAFAQVYARISQTVIAAAAQADVVYAVPGDPTVAESTVVQLRRMAAKQGIPLTVVNGVSFIEPICAALELDAIDGLQIVDALNVAAMHHPPINPDCGALLGQVYSRDVANAVKLVLMNQYPDEFRVALVHHAGEAQQVEWLPLFEIDRSPHIDHLTALYVPPIGNRSSFEAFQEVIAHLRAPEGCPWDRAQSHESLRPYLIEEAYEVLDALNRNDMPALMEELGDLLLQVVLHTQIATENGEFTMPDVIAAINAKMIRRHPHVWGTTEANTPNQVVANWEQIKRTEKAAKGEAADGFTSVLDDIPASFTALMRAQKYARRAAKLGFDYADLDGVRAKIHEELAELAAETTPEAQLDEAGDLVFAVVDLLRWLDIEAEVALEAANAKFARRFRHVERQVFESGKPMKDYTLEALDQFWRAAKKAT
ncbi:MAG: nucleoside triphosphate pyrophosphohydrolase [Phototrophicaceae bacterium]|jgi:tetrapyrrole methylase family protein/MazG family protein